MLQFDGAGGPYAFNSAVKNAGNATLNINADLTTNSATVATIKTINIGTAGAANSFNIGVNANALSLLANGGSINLLNANSNLIVQPQQAQTVTFNGSLSGTGGGGGILTLDGSNGDLTLQGAPGTGATIGKTNSLTAINVSGKVEILGGANSLNVSGTQALNLAAGSVLIDASLTTVNINKITIGEAAGSAEYGIDVINAPGGAFTLNTAGIIFGNAASILGIQSSAPAGQNTTITLKGNLDPGAAGTGILGLKALNAGETLTIAGAVNLGVAGGNTLQEVIFAGDGSIVMQQATINVLKDISTGVANLTLGDINVGVSFTDATNLTIKTTGGNIALNNQAGIVNLSSGGTVNGTIDGSTKAILNFLGAGTVTGGIGAANALTAVNFNGAGAVALQSTANATTFTVNNAGANITATGLMTGNVNFTANGTLVATKGVTGNVSANGGTFTGNVIGNGSVGTGTFIGNVTGDASVGTGTFTGNITNDAVFTGAGTIITGLIKGPTDFAGNNGKVNVNDGGSLGSVTSSKATAGNLAFAGSANVTGVVSNINEITLNGVAGKIVNFQQNVSAMSVTYGGASTANFVGNLTTTNSIDFANNAAVLQFSGPNPTTLSAVLANAGTATLNVYTNLKADDPSIGQIQNIKIGQLNAPKTFLLDTTKGKLTLNSIITYQDPSSIFAITSTIKQEVIFANSFAGSAGGGGILQLGSTSTTTPNDNVLLLDGLTGTETLGTVANPLAAINIVGNVAVGGKSNVTNGLDVSNAAVLNISAKSIFADESITSAQIPIINIGDNTGPATYALDAVNGDFTLKSKKVNFVNPESVFRLMTSENTGKTSTITLTSNITASQSTPQNNAGIVSLYAENKGSILVINGKFSLGTAAQPLQQVNFEGDGAIGIVSIVTKNILMSTPYLGIETVNANAFYGVPLDPTSTPTQFGTTTVVGDMDFQNVAGTAIFKTLNNVAPSISGYITSTGGTNGNVVAIDNLTVNGPVTNITMFKGGADNSTVTFNAPDSGDGVTMSVGEIQGTGTGTIVFAQNTNLDGDINLKGGTAVNLIFQNGGSIGSVGVGGKVGDIDIFNTLLVFNGDVHGGYITLSSGGDVQFNGLVDVIDISDPPINSGTNIIFKETTPEIYAGSVGSKGMVTTIQITGNDVTILGTVVAGSAAFTTTQAATLTFGNTTQIGGVTAVGNGINTIALAGNTTIGNSSIGSASNTLKTIQFTADATFTDNSPSTYSTITTNAPNQGTVILGADNGFTSGLGDSNNSLKSVQFTSVGSTVNGDTYAQNISISSGKSAIFSGSNSRSLSVPSSTIGGVSVSRATPQFNYQTLVSSSNFVGADGTASAKFTNAALVQAPINGGNLTFNDDVWLQKPVTGTNTITFAPQKTTLISAALGANNIVADQATMMFVGDNVNIPVQGNITGSNITFDLGNNTVTYSGTAAPTGNLIISVLYDTANAGQTGNANSGNIVLANGATLDLSGVTSIQVLLNAQNNPGGIGQNSAYPIISSAGGSIIPGNAANLPFNVTANENGFVRWVINNNSFTLYPMQIIGNVRLLPTSPRVSTTVIQNMINPIVIIPDLINPTTTGGGGGGSTPSKPPTGGGVVVGYIPTNPSTPLVSSDNPTTGGTGGTSPKTVSTSPKTGGTIGQGPSVDSGGGSNAVTSGTAPKTVSSSNAVTGSSSTSSNSVYSPSTNSTRNNVGGYTPSAPPGGGNPSGGQPPAVNSGGNPSTVTSGTAPNNTSSPAATAMTPNNTNSSSSGSSAATGMTTNGGSSSAATAMTPNNTSSSSSGSSAATGITPNNTSSPAAASITTDNTSSSSSGNSAATGIAPANNNGGSNNIFSTGSSDNAGSSSGSSGSSGGSATGGASSVNPNDGFNAAKDNTNGGTQKINERIDTLKNADGNDAEEGVAPKRGAAVGGGDCDLDYNTGKDIVYGVWTVPYYGKAVQKAMNGLSGYKARSAGGSIGVDTVINGNVLGAAFTRVDTKLNYQGGKAGNTTKVQTNMGSIYGLYRLVDNFFVEGIVTYSRSDIKTNELRNILGGYETAQGKYRSTSYSTEVIGGYSYLWNNTSLSPMIGLRLAKIKDGGYSEHNTSFQNLTIQKRQFNKVEGILGAELRTTFYKDDFIIKPQVHAFVNYDFKGTTPPINASLDGIELPTSTSKSTRMLYNLGTGIVVDKGRMEYGFHYGLNLAKKYHAQSGTLRLKVNL